MNLMTNGALLLILLAVGDIADVQDHNKDCLSVGVADDSPEVVPVVANKAAPTAISRRIPEVARHTNVHFQRKRYVESVVKDLNDRDQQLADITAGATQEKPLKKAPARRIKIESSGGSLRLTANWIPFATGSTNSFAAKWPELMNLKPAVKAQSYEFEFFQIDVTLEHAGSRSYVETEISGIVTVVATVS